METRYSFITWRTSSRVSRGWMLHETYTVDTPDSLTESAPAERQGCSHENVWLHNIDRQLDGLPSWLNEQEGTLLFPCLDGSSGYQPPLCMSQQGKLWPVSIGESIPVQNCNHEKDCGTRTACLEAGEADYLYAHCRHRCSYRCWHDLVQLNIWATSEWPLAWARMIGLTTSTPFVKAWGATITNSRSLPAFHAFSGCDTTAFKGKTSVWQACQAHIDVMETSLYLAGHPFSAAGCRRRQFRIALDNDGHPLCQNQSCELCYRDEKRTFRL